MTDFEPSGDDIFNTLPEEIRVTTVTDTNGPLTISYVDPEKVERLISTFMVGGINKIRYREGETRKLDPDLARKFAESASVTFSLTVPSLYSRNPGEMDQWIPNASSKVTLKHPHILAY